MRIRRVEADIGCSVLIHVQPYVNHARCTIECVVVINSFNYEFDFLKVETCCEDSLCHGIF